MVLWGVDEAVDGVVWMDEQKRFARRDDEARRRWWLLVVVMRSVSAVYGFR